MLLPKTWNNLYYPPEKNQYLYFAPGRQYPFSTSSRVKAAWAADAAMLAYGRYGQARIPPDEFAAILSNAGFPSLTLIGDWSANGSGTQAYFCSSANAAILAFRGTERDDPADLVMDGDLVPNLEPDATAPAPTISSFPRHPFHAIADLIDGAPCMVHIGFQRALDSVWPAVSACIRDYRAARPDAEICFTGHSLGAALATLAITRFADPNLSLYTIGCPRVGNRTFGQRVSVRATRGAFRYVNANDPVTHIPVDSLAYCHPPLPWMHITDADQGQIAQLGSEENPHSGNDWMTLAEIVRSLPDSGLPSDMNAPAPADLVDHSPAQYAVALWRNIDPELQPIQV